MTDRDTRIPRWVKVTVLVAILLALLVVVVLLLGGGHGPRRHGAGPAPDSLVVLDPTMEVSAWHTRSASTTW